MKKTMLALMATVGLAFVAKADDVVYSCSTNFEGATLGNLYPTSDGYWGIVAEDDDSKYVAYETAPDKHAALYAADETNERYLAVETGTNVLLRSARPGDTVNFGSIYFDTMVQFTASDGDVAPETGDKLIVWMKADEENNTTNLMITAGVLDEDLYAVGVTNYTVTGNYQAGEWYRLTVKTYPTIGLAATVPGFRVFIDGEEVEVDESENLYNGKYFASLVSRDQMDASILTGIGFKGTGAVDDIAMTSYDPIPEEVPYTLTLTLEDEDGAITAVTVNGTVYEIVDASQGLNVTFPTDTETLTIEVDLMEDYAISGWESTTKVITVAEALEDGTIALTLTVTAAGGGGEESAQVVPGTPAEVVAESAEAAVAKAEKVIPEAVKTAVGAGGETYLSYFELVATETETPGTYNVEMVLNADGTNAVQAVFSAITANDTGVLAVALGGDSETTTVSVTVPAGFYYALSQGAALNSMTHPAGELSDGEAATVTPSKELGTAGFYQMIVSPTAIESTESVEP